MKVGDRVKIDFIGESATIYSGKRFTGYGVLDRVEDGRVFGRLDDGTPFMCLCTDVEVVGMSDFEKYWNEHGDVYAMDVAENAWDYQQSKIDELTKQRDSFIKAYEIEMDKSVELQKRIDEALEDLEYPTAPWDETIASVIGVLRGASD